MSKYFELLKKYDDLRQYAIHFPGDYSEQIALDVGKVMGILIDTELIKKTIWNRGRKPGEESICIFSDSNDKRCFILLECDPGDWIYTIIVRCSVDRSIIVKELLLDWYKRCGEEENLPIKQIDSLEDCMFDEQNPLLETVRRHKLDTL